MSPMPPLPRISSSLPSNLRPRASPASSRSLVPCVTAAEQAAFVAQRMLELREEGADMNQMAVLYRSHFHALELQLELTRRNIPFSITSGIRFFEQAHIKDVAAHLKLLTNPRDELAFKRIVQLLPGIGGKGADKLWLEFQSKYQMESTKSPASLAAALQACSKSVPKKAVVAWAQLAATMSQLETKPVAGNPGKMIRLVLEAGYEDYLQDNFANYRNRVEDLGQLAIFAQQFPDTGEFLAQLALLTNVEAESDRPANNDAEQVRLSTIHQAKGLEFDVVFVIMLCDGLFPSARSLDTADGEEEERRLFYVAITRARNELYLTYPLSVHWPEPAAMPCSSPRVFWRKFPGNSWKNCTSSLPDRMADSPVGDFPSVRLRVWSFSNGNLSREAGTNPGVVQRFVWRGEKGQLTVKRTVPDLGCAGVEIELRLCSHFSRRIPRRKHFDANLRGARKNYLFSQLADSLVGGPRDVSRFHSVCGRNRAFRQSRVPSASSG